VASSISTWPISLRGWRGFVLAKNETCQRSVPLRKTSRVEPRYSRRSRRTFAMRSAIAPARAAVRTRPGGTTSSRGGRTSCVGLTAVPGKFVGRPPEVPGERTCAAAGAALSRTTSSAAQQSALRAREALS